MLRPSQAGSSPRGRGKRQVTDLCAPDSRLIPAWAGKTSRATTRPPASRAHPRVGGENVHTDKGVYSAGGSSPRGRGKRGRNRPRTHGHGLIPAWAGKTLQGVCSLHRTPAHPRVGGENGEDRELLVSNGGSSPRGRGKRPHLPTRARRGRLIPAWAGKTGQGSRPPGPRRAHPRVGGENGVGKQKFHGVTGSSPRGRGKPRLSGCQHVFSWLIPAWAGKTPSIT